MSVVPVVRGSSCCSLWDTGRGWVSSPSWGQLCSCSQQLDPQWSWEGPVPASARPGSARLPVGSVWQGPSPHPVLSLKGFLFSGPVLLSAGEAGLLGPLLLHTPWKPLSYFLGTTRKLSGCSCLNERTFQLALIPVTVCWWLLSFSTVLGFECELVCVCMGMTAGEGQLWLRVTVPVPTGCRLSSLPSFSP